MDKKKIKEKAREAAKFTYEVIDDIFGKRILIFAYILAAIFAGTALFQVFTKYVYEEGFSTADALVATIIHTFTKIWGGILYGVLPGFGVFIVLYCVAKSIRNKNLKLRAEAEAVRKAEEAKRLEEERRRQEEEERLAEEERLKAEELARLMEEAEKARLKAEAEAKIKDIADKQRIEAENYEETLRIQREEGQYAQHMHTRTANFGAYQVEKQAEVGVAGAQALGQMGANGAGDVNIGGGGDGTGFNMAAMMASMAVGGAVGQNIAGAMNNMMGGINQQTTPGAVPPPIPTVAYHVAVNGQATGPFDISILTQMTKTAG